mgnify:CR=1 FL=1
MNEWKIHLSSSSSSVASVICVVIIVCNNQKNQKKNHTNYLIILFHFGPYFYVKYIHTYICGEFSSLLFYIFSFLVVFGDFFPLTIYPPKMTSFNHICYSCVCVHDFYYSFNMNKNGLFFICFVNYIRWWW